MLGQRALHWEKTMNKPIVMLIALLCSVFNAAADKILIVSDEWPQMEVFAAYLEREGGYTVEKVEQDAMPPDLSGYHGVVQFVHGMLQDDPAAKLIDYATGGGRLMVLHHGVSAAKKNTKGWYDFLGMELDRTKGTPKYYEWIHGITLTVANLNPGHYITSHKVKYPHRVEYTPSDQPSMPLDAPALEFKDTEVFLNHQFTDGRAKTVLFGFRYEDAKTGAVHMQDRAGWYKATGAGWLFYFQPGHIVSDFEDPNYAQILLNCFTWQQG
jgi:hypothetical protein